MDGLAKQMGLATLPVPQFAETQNCYLEKIVMMATLRVEMVVTHLANLSLATHAQVAPLHAHQSAEIKY